MALKGLAELGELPGWRGLEMEGRSRGWRQAWELEQNPPQGLGPYRLAQRWQTSSVCHHHHRGQSWARRRQPPAQSKEEHLPGRAVPQWITCPGSGGPPPLEVCKHAAVEPSKEQLPDLYGADIIAQRDELQEGGQAHHAKS